MLELLKQDTSFYKRFPLTITILNLKVNESHNSSLKLGAIYIQTYQELLIFISINSNVCCIGTKSLQYSTWFPYSSLKAHPRMQSITSSGSWLLDKITRHLSYNYGQWLLYMPLKFPGSVWVSGFQVKSIEFKMSLVFEVEKGRVGTCLGIWFVIRTFGSHPLGLHREKQDEVQQCGYLNRETQHAFSPNR